MLCQKHGRVTAGARASALERRCQHLQHAGCFGFPSSKRAKWSRWLRWLRNRSSNILILSSPVIMNENLGPLRGGLKPLAVALRGHLSTKRRASLSPVQFPRGLRALTVFASFLEMNEIDIVRVMAFLVGRETLGRAAGAVIRAKLIGHIDGKPGVSGFRLSMQGVKKVDVAFLAEALIAVVRHNLRSRSVTLSDVADMDVLENLTAAAERAKVPVTLWNGQTAQVIGLAPTRGTRDALEFALARPEVKAAEFARVKGLSAANASNKFKQL